MKRLFPWVLLGLAFVAAAAPLAVPWPIAGHSALSDLVRVEAIHAAVAGGDRLPAWLPDLYDRHGSPLPSFYAPLGYLVVELVRLLSVGSVAAVKLTTLLFWLAGIAGAAAATRALCGRDAESAALAVAAGAYALAPYLLIDLYVRVGVAEIVALGIAPWTLTALWSEGRRSWALGAVGIAALVLSHNLTALLVVPGLALLALAEPGGRRTRGLTMVALGLVLSAFFWLPALVEKERLWAESSLTSGFFDYEQHFVRPWNLLPGRRSLQMSVPPDENVGLRFGELLWAGLVAAPWLAWRRSSPERRRVFAASGLAFAALVMTTTLAAPAWQALPLVRFLQFPFRWFLLATLLAAPLVGVAASGVPRKVRTWVAGGAIACALLLARPWLEVRYLFFEAGSFAQRPVAAADLERAVADPRILATEAVVTLERLRRSQWTGTAGHEYLPRDVERLPIGPVGEAAEALDGGIEVISSSWGYPEVRAQVRVTSPGRLALHQFWFPGWKVRVDGEPRPSRPEPGRGRIVVDLRSGDREAVARFGPTPLRRTAFAVSVAAAVLLAVALLASRRKAPTPS